MFKFLVSPVIGFTDRLSTWFHNYAKATTEEVEPTKRLLVYPVTDGLRIRNMAESRSVLIKINQGKAIIEFTIDGVDQLSMTKVFSYSVHIGQIGECLVEFFGQA